MAHLVPCPACSRHVLASERGCPFCGVELPANVSPPAALPRTRLGRAAMFAAGATLVGVAACKDGTASKDAGADRDAVADASGAGGAGGGGVPTGGRGGAGAAAGAAGRGTAGASGGAAGALGIAGAPGTGGAPGSGGAALYGAPPFDAGTGTGGAPSDAGARDASSPVDASQDRGVIALYGAAPMYDLSPAPKPERGR